MKAKLIRLLGGASSLVPVAVAVGINHEHYFTNTTKTVTMSFALGIMIIVALLSSLGALKRKYGGSITTLTAICVISYALQPILLDICMLSGMLLIGQVGNKAIFVPIANVVAHRTEIKQTMTINKKLEAKYERR